MAKRNSLRQEYYRETLKYWKDENGNPTKEYIKWLENKILTIKKLKDAQ